MFKAIYKCRLCGEFITSHKCINHSFNDGELKANVNNEIKYFSLLQEHKCYDGSLGIADFQGFKNTELQDKIIDILEDKNKDK